jgi:CDP-diacylglycerol pyrophosphatase
MDAGPIIIQFFASRLQQTGVPLRLLSYRYARAILLSLLLAVALSVAENAHATESRDALLTIISNCLDIHAPDYCKHCLAPRGESPCAQNRDCNSTTEVWEETTDYVAIRDRKMCGCAFGFVHGLVIPRAQISGIEDPKRPDKIWGIAWAIARKRIVNEDTIALVVNPPGSRSQDQLHIHIVRLRDDARRHFNEVRSGRLWNINKVWNAAAEIAKAAKLVDYGVLVTLDRGGGYLVLVDEKNLEKLYTQWECK